ncbi:Ger(x)C family spore germination protein [Paenibacillus sp. GCM10023252]|uniref:Ger(x)C family spore germination protein n=1 Tax=Paenibacillus sp. GCM10023252 TaxID=3252649 RepID=UPI00360CCF88
MHKAWIGTIVTAALLALLLTGCGDQRVLEKLGFIHTVSYDLIEKEEGPEDDDLQVTIRLRKSDPYTDQVKNETISVSAHTVKQAKIKQNQQSEGKLVSGQIRNVLFGISMARKGIWPIINTVLRDPYLSPRVKVTVVDGDAHSLTNKEYPQHLPTGQYIVRLLEKEAKSHTVPRTTLHEFVRDYHDDGVDPIAPIIKESDNHIAVTGIALFQDDVYKGRLNATEAMVFAFLKSSFSRGGLNLVVSSGDMQSITSDYSKSRRTVQVTRGIDGHSYHVSIFVKAVTSITEYTGEKSTVIENDRIERELAARLTKQGAEVIHKLQQSQVDSLGIGKYVRNSMTYSEWSALDWRSVYPTVQIDCKFKVTIKDYGRLQ